MGTKLLLSSSKQNKGDILSGAIVVNFEKFQTNLQCHCNWLETWFNWIMQTGYDQIFGVFFRAWCCCFKPVNINTKAISVACNLQNKNSFQRTSRDQKLMTLWIMFILSGSPSETWSLNCDITEIAICSYAEVSNFKHVVRLTKISGQGEIFIGTFQTVLEICQVFVRRYRRGGGVLLLLKMIFSHIYFHEFDWYFYFRLFLLWKRLHEWHLFLLYKVLT